MAGFEQPGDGARDQPDAGLVILDFLRNTDDSFALSRSVRRDAPEESSAGVPRWTASLRGDRPRLGPRPRPNQTGGTDLSVGRKFLSV